MTAERLSDNLMQPFQLESSALRGRVIRLGDTVDRVLTRHRYPEPVSRLLGELLVLTATLAGALKFAGVFSLQTKSDGPVSFMVADCTADGALRGYARYDAERVAALPGEPDAAALLGRGHLALTVDQGRYSDAYQGIVELAGESLTDSMRAYFRQSEQLQTGLRTAVERVEEAGGGARWRAGGLMVQRLPEEAAGRGGNGERHGEPEEDWRRTMILLGSATDRELVDPDLPASTLLYRLFHEEGVRVFRPMTLGFVCRCSRERVEALLRSFPEDALEEMKLPDGRVDVTCEFCNEDYAFDESELRALRGARSH